VSDTIRRREFSIAAVIPAYNVAGYVGRAIESVLAQTRPVDEIIVVDDGSTDNTAEVVKSFGDKVVFIQQPNGGASVARNTAIEAAGGEWIAFLDADDEWLPQKLAEQVALHAENPDLAWSATNYEIRPIDGSLARLTFDRDRMGSLVRGETIDNYFDAVAADMAISTITIMARKSVIVDAGMFRVGQWWAQDTDLFFRVAYKWPQIGYLQEPLSVNHFGRCGSITQTNRFLVEQRCDLIERHLELAASHGMSESFRPCAIRLLSRWLRGYVDQPSADISPMLDRFNGFLPQNLKLEMRMRHRFPRLAGALFKVYGGAKSLVCPGRSK